jgi:hypothetical protein
VLPLERVEKLAEARRREVIGTDVEVRNGGEYAFAAFL